ncbi:unnamed protein product [Linum trigynum]|uniref:Uncharacterized protein n=1 Tax=Linum trigynum TaxID=586398 RepID=A0AAV2DW65_9ROSI
MVVQLPYMLVTEFPIPLPSPFKSAMSILNSKHKRKVPWRREDSFRIICQFGKSLSKPLMTLSPFHGWFPCSVFRYLGRVFLTWDIGRGVRTEQEEKLRSWLYSLGHADKDLAFEYVRSRKEVRCFPAHVTNLTHQVFDVLPPRRSCVLSFLEELIST